MMDKNIKPLVFLFNKLPGFKTIQSCEGHTELPVVRAYIWFNVEDENKFSNETLFMFCSDKLIGNFHVDIRKVWSIDSARTYANKVMIPFPHYEFVIEPSHYGWSKENQKKAVLEGIKYYTTLLRNKEKNERNIRKPHKKERQ